MEPGMKLIPKCLLQMSKCLLEAEFSISNLTLSFPAASKKRKNLISYVIHDIYKYKQSQFPPYNYSLC